MRRVNGSATLWAPLVGYSASSGPAMTRNLGSSSGRIFSNTDWSSEPIPRGSPASLGPPGAGLVAEKCVQCLRDLLDISRDSSTAELKSETTCNIFLHWLARSWSRRHPQRGNALEGPSLLIFSCTLHGGFSQRPY